MRRAIAAAIVGAGLAACGQPAGPGAATAPAGFPKPTASYVGQFQMDFGDQMRPATIYASGAKIRLEGPPPSEIDAKDITIATVMDQATRKVVLFRVGPDAPKAAMAMDLDQLGAAASLFELDKEQPNARIVGEDKIAGVACRIWEIPGEAAGSTSPPADQLCLTDDGIVLRANAAGAADKPTMLAQEIRRGSQDAALFAAPPGFEIIDYTPCTTIAAEAMLAAGAGKKPDVAKMQECAALGEKVSAIFGD